MKFVRIANLRYGRFPGVQIPIRWRRRRRRGTIPTSLSNGSNSATATTTTSPSRTGDSKLTRKSFRLAACVSILVVSALPALADDTSIPCSLATLHGTYAFAGPGTDGAIAFTTSGRETYDGQGHIRYFQLWDEAGVTYTYTGTGTYTMTSDCVATATYGVHSHFTYFVAPDGSTF